MKWYKRDPNAALDGMATLTLEERGAYNSLLDILYSSDGVVPDDDRFVARRMSVDVRTWRPVRRRLIEKGKVWVVDGYLMAKRVTAEVISARFRSDSASKQARLRWDRGEKHFHFNGSAGMQQCSTAMLPRIRKTLLPSDSETVTAHDKVAGQEHADIAVTPELAGVVKRNRWS